MRIVKKIISFSIILCIISSIYVSSNAATLKSSKETKEYKDFSVTVTGYYYREYNFNSSSFFNNYAYRPYAVDVLWKPKNSSVTVKDIKCSLEVYGDKYLYPKCMNQKINPSKKNATYRISKYAKSPIAGHYYGNYNSPMNNYAWKLTKPMVHYLGMDFTIVTNKGTKKSGWWLDHLNAAI